MSRDYTKRAESLIKNLPAAVTGARDGDLLVGIFSSNKNAVMRIHLPEGMETTPISGRAINDIKQANKWTSFVNRLRSLDYFSSMSLDELNEWFDEYTAEDLGDVSWFEIEGIEFEMFSLGHGDKNKLADGTAISEENALKLLRGRWTPKDASDLFKLNILMWKMDFWSVKEIYKLYDSSEIDPSTVVYRIDTGKRWSGEVGNIYSFNAVENDNSTRLYLWSPKTSMSLSVDLKDIMKDTMQDVVDKYEDQIDFVLSQTRHMTLGQLKSLVQKIVRFGPKYVLVDRNTKVNALLVLCIACILTVIHPGAFIPDLQVFSSGVHSIAKRLLVIVYEDTYFDEETPISKYDMLGVALCALLTQRVTHWTPSKDIVKRWLRIAMYAYKEPRIFNYDIPKGLEINPWTISDNPLETTSAILDAIGSFSGDKALVRDVAKRWNQLHQPIKTIDIPYTMPLSHYVDQHATTRFIYLVRPDVVEEFTTPGAEPFHPFVNNVFGRVTGINPRLKKSHPRGYHRDMEQDSFVQSVRDSQWRFHDIMMESRMEISKDHPKKQSVSYELDDAWLAGTIGTIEVKVGSIPVIVVIHLETLELVAIPKPKSRSKEKPEELTSEQEESAVQKAYEKLSQPNGIPLKDVPIDSLFGSRVRAEKIDGELLFDIKLVGQDWQPWDVVRRGKEKVGVMDAIDLPLRLGQYHEQVSEYGVVKNLKNAMRSFLNLDYMKRVPIVQQILNAISTRSRTINLSSISRSGGSQMGEQSPSMYAPYINEALNHIARIAPAALRRKLKTVGKFYIPLPPLLWKIHKTILKHLRSIETQNNNAGDWPSEIVFEDNREPRQHQLDALRDMKGRFKKGYRGHFIWMTVGLGKTYLTGLYLSWLRSRGHLPKYVIFTTPKIASATVYEEMDRFNIDINWLVPSKALKTKYMREKRGKNIIMGEPIPYTVTLIEHDHMRMMTDVIYNVIGESVFIVDEVQQFFNVGTQRTTVGHNLAMLCRDLIALTGTPIVNSNTSTLIPWLSLIVPFEVTDRNFWVAAKSMIAYTQSTGIPVNRNDIVISNDLLPDRYRDLVTPALGGRAAYMAPTMIREAMDICWNVCTDRIIDEVIKYINLPAFNNGVERGAMVVALNQSHQRIFFDRFTQLIGEDAVYAIGISGPEVNMLPPRKQTDPRVLIVTKSQAEGYTATIMNAMFKSVYPSNNAKRDQMDGRINRLSQNASELLYITVHTGILSNILEHHEDARTLEQAIHAIATEV